MSDNIHHSNGHTSARFITREEREQGVDPAAVAAAAAAAARTAATSQRGVNVQMVTPGRPVPSSGELVTASAKPQQVELREVRGLPALVIAQAHGVPVLVEQEDGARVAVLASSLAPELDSPAWLVLLDALGKPVVPPAPAAPLAPPGAPPGPFPPMGGGGGEATAEKQLGADAHALAAFTRTPGVPHRVELRGAMEVHAAAGTVVSVTAGPRIIVRLSPPGESD